MKEVHRRVSSSHFLGVSVGPLISDMNSYIFRLFVIIESTPDFGFWRFLKRFLKILIEDALSMLAVF